MKKFIAIMLILTSAVSISCASRTARTAGKNPAGKLSVVCTAFAQYDWVREITGARDSEIELTLLGGGADLHSYQPTAQDIVKISECDLFIYVGGESEMWVSEALRGAVNEDMQIVNLIDALGEAAKQEEYTQGMTGAAEHGHTHETAEDEQTIDEHVWLSLRNAEFFCSVIADALIEKDGQNEESYRRNLNAYTDKLRELDADYRAALSSAAEKTLLFCDRFPFRYLLDDYEIEYYAAFPGCSAETEASFETLVFLVSKIDEHGLKSVLVTESSDMAIAKTVIGSAKSGDLQILVLDSMQSVTAEGAGNESRYISIMRTNLNVLKEALGLAEH